MKKLKDSTLERLKTYEKYTDLYDLSTLECRTALVSSLVFSVIAGAISIRMGNDCFANEWTGILLNISLALIGFLGFIVTGLAILTSAISNRLYKILKISEKTDVLEKILMSFYFLGLLSASVVIVSFILFEIAQIDISAYMASNIVIAWILSYMIVYIIMYAVGLIGNCLELFFIINEIELASQEDKTNIEQEYLHCRVMALEWVLLKGKDRTVLESYSKKILEIINKSEKTETEKEKLRQLYKMHFGKNTADV